MKWFQCLIFSTLLTIESVPDFNSAAKIKALLELGQRLYSKNATSQVLVLIQIRAWIPYQIKIRFKGTGDLYQYISFLTTVHRILKDDRGFKDFPSAFIKSHHSDHLAALGPLRKSKKAALGCCYIQNVLCLTCLNDS